VGPHQVRQVPRADCGTYKWPKQIFGQIRVQPHRLLHAGFQSVSAFCTFSFLLLSAHAALGSPRTALALLRLLMAFIARQLMLQTVFFGTIRMY
jgi:hypothetical protein